MSLLDKPYFRDEAAAFAKLEAVVWPNGPVCPHCKNTDTVYSITGASARQGLKKCGACRKQFTVRVGTVFESSHVPLHKWFQAVHLLCSSKKGISAHQLHRTLEVTYKTAWFMAHRIREAMRGGDFDPLGGSGKHVEADETYFGPTDEKLDKGNAGPANKRAVIGLVERGGRVVTFHVDKATRRNVSNVVALYVNRESRLQTDESALYRSIGKSFEGGHGKVRHAAHQWRKGEDYTNTIEGYFSIFKRGMKGVYQHCSEKHLHRYLAEFDFRYNNRSKLGVEDGARTERALRGIVGRRITYRGSSGAGAIPA